MGARQKFFDVPHFYLVPHCPNTRGHNDCLLPTERQLKCPLVSALLASAVCTSTGEVETRGAIKVIGPSAVLCRLLGY